MSKFKNFLKTSAKWGAASVVLGTAGAVTGAQMSGADVISKLPKFAQGSINKFLNKDLVKGFASSAGEVFEKTGLILTQAAKAHPIAATAALGLSAISSIVGLK